MSGAAPVDLQGAITGGNVIADTEKRGASKRPDRNRGLSKGELRAAQRSRAQRRKSIRTFIITGGVSLGAFLLIAGIVLGNGLLPGPNREFQGPLLDDAADEQSPPDNLHINPTSTVTHGELGAQTYSTVPATSGRHYQAPVVILQDGNRVAAPAAWGTYDFHLPDEVLVHNLEHGGIGLHYDPTACAPDCSDVVADLREFVFGSHSQFIVSPYNGLLASTGSPIAVTGWRHHILLDQVDGEEDRIQEFIDTYRDRAPESVPSNQFPPHS